MTTLLYLATFAVVALASRQIGKLFPRIRLPLISGYLLAGLLAGPFVLGLMPEASIPALRFLDEISLAFIAFAAGSELYLKDLRSRLRSIGWTAAGLTIVTFHLSGLAVLLLSDFIPFLRPMPLSHRVGVAALAGAILVARSPSSAIAVVDELRAKGPFTKTMLGVTILMDGIVIVLFAINSSLADALITGLGVNLLFFVLLATEVASSIAAGVVVGKLLDVILGSHVREPVKAGLMLLTGYAVFATASELRIYSHEHFAFEVFLEPLLICMIAGFFVINRSRYRNEFLRILHDVSPFIYVIFFTLTGASLALDTLARAWRLTLVLFGTRLAAIFVGSFSGGVLAGEPMRRNRIAWMGYITQAGVGIGLAKEVAVEFPEWGAAFATTVIAVIIINQIVGPPLLKSAIKRVGESHLPELASPDEVREVIILGIEPQSLALARQLKAHNWQVVMADTDASHVKQLEEEDVEERLLTDISAETLSSLTHRSPDALVAMLEDDDANLTACRLAHERFGIPRIIVRLNDPTRTSEFADCDAFVVDPTSAMVHLLDQSVRAPQSAALLLHMEPEYDTTQVTVKDPDFHGIPLRDLRLPADVLVLNVVRDKQPIVPHGYTTLQLGDEVTLAGTSHSLIDVTRQLGY